MNARGQRLIDARLDLVARTAWEVLAARLLAGVGAGLLALVSFGGAFAGAWFAAFLFTESGARLASGKAMRGGSMTPVRRVAYLVLICAASLTWCALAVRCWAEGGSADRLAALAILVSLMVHAQGFSYRAPIAMAALGGPPAALWLLLPAAFGGYGGVDGLVLACASVLALAYMLVAARANARTAQAGAEAEQRAMAASEAKSAFLNMVTHELRTPLNGVLGMARALQRTRLDDQQARYLGTILKSGDDLLALLNDLLDHAKIEAGRLELDVTAFDLRHAARQAVDLWTEAAAAKRLDLVCELDAGLPDHVLGDEIRVRQILLNLLSNALKFTESGYVLLTIRPSPAADGEGGVEIEVQDTGPGISEAQAARLFRPFAQAEPGTARRDGGTGLGLSICRQLAARMGGEISVQSTPGQGSTFKVWLPLPACAPDPGAVQPPATALPPLRALVVDDNPVNLAVARTLLEAAGAEVETAASGSEGLERLRRGGFEVVLMDLHMPGLDGVEATRRIRSGQAGPADVPVIALTADARPGEAARLRALGFDGVQAKPVVPEALFAAINAAVAGRPGREAAA